MSRKSLISFDEIAEGNPNFLDIDYHPDWKAQFQNDHPLHLEVGFGNGSFLIEMAIQYSNVNFIGIDFYHKGIRKTISRIEKLQLKNVRIVYGDAREKIPGVFKENELKTVYINFPDPWPKKRHIKRRLIKPSFVRMLAEKLEPGGELHAATDSEPYASEMLDYFESEPRLANKAGLRCFMENRNGTPPTKYEKNFINSGKKIFYLELIKK